MPPEANSALPGRTSHATASPSLPWVRIAVVIWSAVLAVIWVRCLFQPKDSNTYWYFSEGGADWLAGRELYQVAGGSCRYSPLFHALMAPLALLPDRLGALLWRMLNAGVFLAGMACWIRMLLPRGLDRNRQALLFLLALPVALGSINNAQANPLMAGLILLALAAAAGERWNWSALCIALACLLKIYPVAVGLLLVLIYPRQFAARFLAALALGLGLPFVLHDPGYVARQYGNWYHLLQIDDRSDMDPRYGYRDLWLLFRLVGLPISRHSYYVVQLGVAGMVAALCWWKARQGAEQRLVMNTILGLAACWMTLCGPATESCTYILLAPSLAWALLEAWHKPEQLAPGLKATVVTSYGVFLASFMANWFPGVNRVHGMGTHPLAALLLLLALAWTSLMRRGTASEAPDPALPVAA